MEKWTHVREVSGNQYDSRTGEKLPTTYTSWIKNDKGDFVGMALDTYEAKFDSDQKILSTKRGAIERGNLIAAAPEAIEFAKKMAEFFATYQFPKEADHLRDECHAVLKKAFPQTEVANAS